MLHLQRLGWGLRRIAREVGWQPDDCAALSCCRGLGGVPHGATGETGCQVSRAGCRSGSGDTVAMLTSCARNSWPNTASGSACARWSALYPTCGGSCWPRDWPRCASRRHPGRQLQIDFGERQIRIGEESVRAYLFVATLGYSRRVFARAFRHERQVSWFEGLEGAFRHFGGLPQEILLDKRTGAGPAARRADARGAVQRALSRLQLATGT